MRLLVRYSQPGLLARNSRLSTSKVRRSGIDRVTRHFPVDPIMAISRISCRRSKPHIFQACDEGCCCTLGVSLINELCHKATMGTQTLLDVMRPRNVRVSIVDDCLRNERTSRKRRLLSSQQHPCSHDLSGTAAFLLKAACQDESHGRKQGHVQQMSSKSVL